MNQPDASMLLPAKSIMQFMETRVIGRLPGVFAKSDVTILDSFAPYFFTGPDAGLDWANRFITHARDIAELRHSFGKPQEFSSEKDSVFFSQPITWTGIANKRPFLETGGLALKLVLEDDLWRIQNYGWAVTGFELK